MYKDSYSKEIARKLSKLKKKDTKKFTIVLKKRDQILENPKARYKDLHYAMGGFKRVHLGHFVLVFRIDHKNKIITFEDYDHHDKIYKEI